MQSFQRFGVCQRVREAGSQKRKVADLLLTFVTGKVDGYRDGFDLPQLSGHVSHSCKASVIVVLVTTNIQAIVRDLCLERLASVHQWKGLLVQLVIDSQDIWPATLEIMAKGHVASE